MQALIASSLTDVNPLNTLKKTNNEKTYQKIKFYGVRFPKQLGLGSILASWDLKIRIPRRKLRM